VQYAKWCRACQIHGFHALTSRVAPSHGCFMTIWSLGNWCNRTISPPSARGRRFILTITDYFSKWVKVVPLAQVKMNNVTNFIKHHVIHRFGVPRRIIHDDDSQFASQSFYQFYDKYQIQNVASTAYNPVAIGLAEVLNKTIIKLSSPRANEIGTRNSANVFGPIEWWSKS